MSGIPYRALDATKKEIRLLTLQPGQWDDVVECRLHIVSLDDQPVYEALSYVWGGTPEKPPERAQVIVDGVKTTATVSLERALRRLRPADEERSLWADALCINQNDVAERGKQVGLMADVYSTCSRCMIWLGEEEDYPLIPYAFAVDDPDFNEPKDVAAFEDYLLSQGQPTTRAPIKNHLKLGFSLDAHSWLDVQAGFDLVKMLIEDTHLYEMPFYRITDFPKFEICRNWENAWHSLINILVDRPWWKRTWTVQEAILPKVAIVQLGRHQIELDTLMSAASRYKKHALDCCEEKYGELWNMFGLGDGFYLVNDLSSLKNKESLEVPYNSILLLTQQKYATDPIDSVYGMLGAFPDLLGPENCVDYNKSAAVVYSQATLRMSQSFGDLNFFDVCSLRKRREHLQLPSWVLDWGKEEDKFPKISSQACGKFTTYKPHMLLPNPLILSITSYRLGTVAEIGEKTEEEGVMPDILLDWISLTLFAEKTFWRTVFQDGAIHEMYTRKPMLEKDFEVVSRWWEWYRPCDLEDSVVSSSQDGTAGEFEQVSDMLAYRCLLYLNAPGTRYFITDSGGPGMARACIEVGDEIHIAKGCRWPIILRPLSEVVEDVPEEIRPFTYNFVSTCYLDGYMGGEGVEGEVDWKDIYLR
jgi:hypothetical protein